MALMELFRIVLIIRQAEEQRYMEENRKKKRWFHSTNSKNKNVPY